MSLTLPAVLDSCMDFSSPLDFDKELLDPTKNDCF